MLLRAPIISISVEDSVAFRVGELRKIGSSRENKVTISKFSMTLLQKYQKLHFFVHARFSIKGRMLRKDTAFDEKVFDMFERANVQVESV